MARDTRREEDLREAPQDRGSGNARPGGPAATIRDVVESERGESPRSILRLPSALAVHWLIESELASRGAEADLLVVGNSAGDRRVAKIYRSGIEPKTEVLQRVGGGSFEHVVRLYDHGRSDGRWFELLEYVEQGSLEDLINQEGPRLTELRIREILVEVATAIDHLHGHDVVHRDIKPSNILVRTTKPLDLVLTDFGIASILGQGSRRFTTGNRTIAYAAPETSAGEVSKAADWWSLGIILVEVLTGRHPFAGTTPGVLLDDRAIMSRLVQMPVDQLVEGTADPWRSLCRGLLRREARNRWSGSEVQRWLRGDTTLTIAEEVAAVRAEYPPFFFAGTGKKYGALPEIAQAFGENWAEARKTVERGHLLNWVKDDLRDNEWRQYLSDLDRDCNDLDERVLRIIVKLDPSNAPVFCGYRLDPEGLQKLASDALANGQASSILAALFARGILLIAADGTGIARYRELHESWNAQLESYKSQADAVVRAGAPRAPIDQSHGQASATMLLSVLPSGQRYISELRRHARDAAKPELQDCDWFRALGEPSQASPQAAFLFPLLAPHAEAPAAQVRALRAQKDTERRAERKRLTLTWGSWAALALFVLVVLKLPTLVAPNITSISSPPTLPPAKAPAPSFLIKNAVVGKSIDAKGRVVTPSSTLPGPTTSIGLSVEYANAQPHKDVMRVTIIGKEQLTDCEAAQLLYVTGEYLCQWTDIPIGEWKFIIWLNGTPFQYVPFTVTAPTPPPPLDIRPSKSSALNSGQQAGGSGQPTTPTTIQPVATFSYEPKGSSTFRHNDLTITFQTERNFTSDNRVTRVFMYQEGKLVLSPTLDDASDGRVALALVYLRKAGGRPQVIFTQYTGGAHCCTVTKIGAIGQEGNWHLINGDTLDGDLGYNFIDLDGDGEAELVSVDNRFLYAFDCYACSHPPTRIHKIVDASLKEVTREPRYQYFIRQTLQTMEVAARSNPGLRRSNGYLAGWVATKAVLNELDGAWRVMLSQYDRNSDWPLEECTVNVELYKCPDTKKRRVTFPDALAKHLLKSNYITPVQQRDLGR